MQTQRTRPGFIGSTVAFVIFEKRQVGHCIRRDEFVFARRELRLRVDASPGARIEIRLLQRISVGIAGVEWHRLGVMRVSVDNVLSPPITKILLC